MSLFGLFYQTLICALYKDDLQAEWIRIFSGYLSTEFCVVSLAIQSNFDDQNEQLHKKQFSEN